MIQFFRQRSNLIFRLIALIGLSSLLYFFLANNLDSSQETAVLEQAQYYLRHRDYARARESFEKCLHLKKKQCHEASYFLALMDIYGWGGDKKIAEGLEKLSPLIDKKDKRALLEAGVIYGRTDSEFFNYEKALEYFTQAAHQKCAVAAKNLGILYSQSDPSKGIKPNTKLSQYWLNKALQQGCAEAAYILALQKIEQATIESLTTEIVPLLEQAANDDHEPSLILLGSLYWRHIAQEESSAKAGEYFKKAAYLCPEGAYRYSLWLSSFDDDDKKTESLKWLRRSADMGFAQAQFLLGLKIEQSSYGSDLSHTARDWYEKAASQDHARALNRLGLFYYKSLYGMPFDENKAISYFSKACELELAEAQNNLALIILYSAAPDYKKAYHLLKQAAAQSYRPAQENVKIIDNDPFLRWKTTAEAIDTKIDVL